MDHASSPATRVMTRRCLVRLMAGSCFLPLVGCSLFDTHAGYRFRMTVEVETPQGTRRGSSVYEIKAVKNGTKLLAEERAGATATFGEAVVIDLPNDTPLFVLMDVPSGKDSLQAVVTHALTPAVPQGGIDNFIAAVRNVERLPLGHSVALPSDDWPKMVRFRDLNDPKTVELVDAVAFGVRRVLIELTSDRPTKRIRQIFPPWFAQYYDSHKLLDGSDSAIISTSDLAGTMGPGSFTRLSSR